MASETSTYSWVFLAVSTVISSFTIAFWMATPYISSVTSFREDLNISTELYGVLTGPIFLSLVAAFSFIHVSLT